MLPNFTLFDDSVDLDVEITFRDLETDQFDSEGLTFSRGASSALTEFAPGNTFYGHGREIRIDAVETGNNGSSLQRWQICPACGWVDVLDDGALTAEACARCTNTAVRDVSQVLDVLPFTAASAVVRRDESAISDRRDDRDRTQFTLAQLADLPPEHTDPAWWVEGYPFGVQMAHRTTIRSLNLGRTASSGADLTLGGVEYRAPRFRVCENCGQLDSAVRANSRSEHRPWCPRLESPPEEHTRSIVLAHELVTQGVLIRLPQSVTARSGFALPSLKAAILLGLRESLGGDPGHLGILQVADASRGTPALLLHDKVPGGTGYLISYSTSDGMRELLEKAFRVIAACQCREEERMACHRCLLPFAAPYETDQVSRAVAADALALLLTAGREDDPDTVDPTEAQWQWEVVVDALAPVEEPESHLESRFPHRAHRATQECRLAGQRAPGRWRPVHRRTHRPQRAALDPQPAAVARLHPAGLRAGPPRQPRRPAAHLHRWAPLPRFGRKQQCC